MEAGVLLSPSVLPFVWCVIAMLLLGCESLLYVPRSHSKHAACTIHVTGTTGRVSQMFYLPGAPATPATAGCLYLPVPSFPKWSLAPESQPACLLLSEEISFYCKNSVLFNSIMVAEIRRNNETVFRMLGLYFLIWCPSSLSCVLLLFRFLGHAFSQKSPVWWFVSSGGKSTQLSYLSKSKYTLIENDSSKSESRPVNYYLSKGLKVFGLKYA